MSLFSNFFDLLKKVWDSIKAALTTLVEKLKEIAPYIIIIAAIYMTGGGALTLLPGLVLTGSTGALWLLGAAFLLLPDEMVAVAGDIAAVIADVVVEVIEAAEPIITAVGEALGTVIAATASALGIVPILIIGAGIYLMANSNSEGAKGV
jgi:hypothetical protein